MDSFAVQLIIGGHRSMFVENIQGMMKSDLFMENPFVNYAVIGLFNGEIVRFTSQKQYSVTQCN